MALTFKAFAKRVLENSDIPLTPQEIWEQGKEMQLDRQLNSKGLTPWSTIGAQLFVDTRDNPDSVFIKVGKRPARFFLKKRQSELSADINSKIAAYEARQNKQKPGFCERDLHPLLAYVVNTNARFNRGRNIYTKTIYHEKSAKKGYSEWLHPDMVGFYIPLEDWQSDLLDFNKITDNNSVRLFSFELKVKLDRTNYREAFFQAVSNSSWAHEGYLVAPNILQDEDLLSELERLSVSFGIGIIELQPGDIDASSILYPAKQRSILDWETMNKLAEQNPDFRKFLQDVKIDFESKRIHASEYDPVLDDPYTYIEQKILKNEKKRHHV